MRRLEALQQIANHINELDYLTDEIRIAEENGKYVIERWYKEKRMGYIFCGDFKETKHYLQGIRAGYFYMKPF